MSNPAPPQNTVSILDLPEEILIDIFSYLSEYDLVRGARQTCRYFYNISVMPDVWRSITVSMWFTEGESIYVNKSPTAEKMMWELLHQKCILPSYDLEKMANRGHGVSRTEVTDTDSGDISNGQSQIGSDTIKPEESGTTIQHGSESGDLISDAGIAVLSKRCEVKSVVRCLKEWRKPWDSCAITSDMVYPNLRKLILIRHTLPQMDFLIRYHDLVHLHLEVESSSDKNQQLILINKPYIANCFDILKDMRNLQTLKFITHSRDRLNKTITKSVTKYFLSGPNLRQISLNLRVNDEIVRTILKHCSQLQDLRLCNSAITSRGFSEALKTPKLCVTTLKLRQCLALDHRALHYISLVFPFVKKLELTLFFNQNIMDESVRLILAAMTHLTVLKLEADDGDQDASDSHLNTDSNDEDFDMERGNNDEADSDGSELDIFVADKDHVSSVNGDYCRKKVFSGYCFSALYNKEVGKLQELALKNFDWLKSEVFVELFQHQPDLHTIKLVNCSVTDQDVITMAKHCPQLHKVTLLMCEKVTAASASALVKMLPYLKNLYCNKNGGGIEHLYKCPPPVNRKEAKNEREAQPNIDSRLETLYVCPADEFSVPRMFDLPFVCTNLAHLTLTDCQFLDDDCVKMILGNNLHLQSLNLGALLSRNRDCRLTDTSLGHIQTMGSDLSSVSFEIPVSSGCQSFTSAALARMVVCCSNLTFFKLVAPIGPDHSIQDFDEIKESLLLLKSSLTVVTSEKKKIISVYGERLSVCNGRVGDEKFLLFHIRKLKASSVAEDQLELIFNFNQYLQPVQDC